MPISAASNVLVTLSEAKAHLEISDADTTFDDRVQILINSASDSIEKFCNRILVDNTNTEYRDGRAGNMLVMKQYPIQSITSIDIDSTGQFSGDETTKDAENYSIDDSFTTIVFSSVLPKGFRNIKVVYVSGLGTAAGDDLPWSLRYACLDYVKWLWKSQSDDRIGTSSKTKAGEVTSYVQNIPDHIQQLLSPFVNHQFSMTDVGIYNG